MDGDAFERVDTRNMRKSVRGELAHQGKSPSIIGASLS